MRAPGGLRRTLTASAVTLLAAFPAALALTPSPPAESSAHRTVQAPAEGSVAVGFSRDMAVHHQQAVDMSFTVLDRGSDPKVHRLAYDIAHTQAAQRGMMLGWLALWGYSPTSGKPPMAWMGTAPPSAGERKQGVLMPGMARREDMDRLREARGLQADRLFLKLMTVHHRGGVHMAEGVGEGSAPAPVVRLARGMVEGQRAEIDLMKKLSAELA